MDANALGHWDISLLLSDRIEPRRRETREIYACQSEPPKQLIRYLVALSERRPVAEATIGLTAGMHVLEELIIATEIWKHQRPLGCAS